MTTYTNLTHKQQTILQLLYRFRFLTRTQIQQFLNHKASPTIQNWLKDLTQKGYLQQIPAKYHTPAIYHLMPIAISYLNTTFQTDQNYLKNLYREDKRSSEFIAQCLFLADIALELKQVKSSEVNWEIFTKADFVNFESFELLQELKSNLYLRKNSEVTTEYFLELFDIQPKYKIRKKIRSYFEQFSMSELEENPDPFPALLLVSKDEKMQNYLVKLIKQYLNDFEEPEIQIRFTTSLKIRELGFGGNVWKGFTNKMGT